MTLIELRDKINRELERGDDPQMPVFMLKGSDPDAPAVVRIWVLLSGHNLTGKGADADLTCIRMMQWQAVNGTKIPD